MINKQPGSFVSGIRVLCYKIQEMATICCCDSHVRYFLFLEQFIRLLVCYYCDCYCRDPPRPCAKTCLDVS